MLLAWYQTVLDSLGADESLPADIFAWLPARFDAWLVTTGRVKAAPAKPTKASLIAASNAAFHAERKRLRDAKEPQA